MEDLSNEKPSGRKKLIPVGWRKQTIVDVVTKESKKGNPMFVFSLFDDEHNYTTEYFAINVPGKRWNLKMMMDSCGYESQENKYDLSEESVKKTTINKDIECLFEHEDNEWINREGNTIITKQHVISDIRNHSPRTTGADLTSVGQNPPVTEPKDVNWDN